MPASEQLSEVDKVRGYFVVMGALALSLSADPAAAGGLFPEDGYRHNCVYGPFPTRSTYRRIEFREYHRLNLERRYHYRIQRQGIDIQLPHRPWAPVIAPR